MSLLIILVMLVLNALMAAYEMAIAATSRTKLAILVQEKRSGAESALYMKDHIEGSLAVVQIGMTVSGAVAAAVGGAGAEQWFSPWLQNSLHLHHHLAHILSVVCVVLPLAALILYDAIRRRQYEKKNRSETEELRAELEALKAARQKEKE